ncbi:glycerophosphodiester phosphodiesterase [Candidatus Saccharibacteria bacterium]|nr:glycerophosphodiester phosphodiesterase [Candidatus Saccharibacteria bacterium]
MPKDFWGSKTPIAIAHRGGDAAGHAKRNTLAAFISAQELGYKYVETDVISTKDGKIIISHGAITSLTAKMRGTHSYKTLQSRTFAQIKKELQVSGEPILLLKDALARFQSTKFFIDPKTDETIEPLAKLLTEVKVLDQVFVGSFKYDRLLKLHALLGDAVKLGVIMDRSNWLKILPRLKTGRLKHIEAVCIHHSFVSRQMINLIHSKGLKAVVWTCNSKLSIRHAKRSGADGIISDKIKLFKEVLETEP